MANEYTRTVFANQGIEPESVDDYLTNMSPAVAPMHAILPMRSLDTIKPEKLMDASQIVRDSTMASKTTTENKAEGVDATSTFQRIPSRFFTRTTIWHEKIEATRTVQSIKLLGIDDAFDYGIDQALVNLVDQQERALLLSTGTENDGSNPVKTRLQGLLAIAAWTGLERRHGTAILGGTNTSALARGSVGDGMQAIKSDYWSSFYDANGTTLDLDMLYDGVLGVPWSMGFETDGSMVMVGKKLAELVARCGYVEGKGAINERSVPARDEAIIDIITMIRTPAMGDLFLMTNRLMSVDGVTMTFDNTSFTSVDSTAGTSEKGSINKAVTLSETLLAWQPSAFNIGVIDGTGYKDLAVAGDYSRGMVVAEKTLQHEHFFGVVGATNLLP